MMSFSSIDEVMTRFAAHGYLMDRSLATTVHLGVAMAKPLFLEGEPGVGKTELAKTLAKIIDGELIRLQCYEGLDIATAVYEWNYPRQMLEIRLQEARHVQPGAIGEGIYSETFLLERPLLRAIRVQAPRRAVLLIDEVDRSDEEFEAYLLELLSDFQISIPEIGTIRAAQPPLVVLTSNRTRQLHEALKRRCLYHWIDYPDFDKELAVLRTRVPDMGAQLAEQLCRFMQWLRGQELHKLPGLAETVDWAEALVALGAHTLDRQLVEDTLGCILKYKGDIDRLRETRAAMPLPASSADPGVRAT